MNEADKWTLRTPAGLVVEWRAEVAELRADADRTLLRMERTPTATSYAALKSQTDRIWLLEHLIALVEALKA